MEFYPCIGSTNDVVKAALEQGVQQGFTVVSLEQRAGYGRQGRTWSSPLGGVYFSVALRPQVPLRQLPTLTIVTALAIRQGLLDLGLVGKKEDVLVKWPNDLVVLDADTQNDAVPTYRKLCGISSEAHANGVCIGIGVNLSRESFVQTDGRYQPAFVSDIAGPSFARFNAKDARGLLLEENACALAQGIVDRLLDYMQLWEHACLQPFVEIFAQCSFLQGKTVRVANILDEVFLEGVVRGIDDQGRLLVQRENGTIDAVVSGEAHLV